ncbi:MAG: class I SAM-dependent methyltransferase [Pseudomonadales bacterium]|nr:class I SAM-dependent methyltransferase [Pseudomonadales bacterium]
MSADTLCQTPFGALRLQRYPTRRDEPLQAWCGADLLLLEELHRLGAGGEQLLVVNDEHGALAIPPAAGQLWTDSALAALALAHNLEANGRPAIPVTWSTDAPAATPAVVALRVPKQLPFLEYQLARLADHIAVGSTVLAAGMDKHLSPRVASLLEHYIGPTQRHRGQRKARLFSACRDGRPAASPPGEAAYRCEAAGGELRAQANVFSRDRLDGGSRLLLEVLPRLSPAATVIDLACGNGVLGLAALRQGLATELVFADESAMAIASARGNVARLVPDLAGDCRFHHGDGLLAYTGAAAGLILCNPPFHLNHAVDEYAGRRLAAQCAAHLAPGGVLCLVANRHLDYTPVLRRNFRHISKLAGDRRFTVWRARRD